MTTWLSIESAPRPPEGGEPVVYLVWDHVLESVVVAELDETGWSAPWRIFEREDPADRPRLYAVVEIPSHELRLRLAGGQP